MKYKIGDKVRLKGTKKYGQSWGTTSLRKGDIVTIFDIKMECGEYACRPNILRIKDFDFCEDDVEPIKITNWRSRLK